MRLRPRSTSLMLLLFALVACGTGAEPDPAATDASAANTIPDTVSTTTLPPGTGGDPSTTTAPPPSSTSPLTTTAAPALIPDDGPLTVPEALKRELEGPATVTGFLFLSDDGAVLAEFLLESYPAQPGGATLPVVGVDPTGFDTESVGRVIWTDRVVEIAGILETGVLYVESENL